MAKFQINILGCGSATPTSRHNPSCQVVDFRDRLMMIDCGEGSQTMMRRMGLKFSRLGHIFISHLHGDHCFGLPGLLSTMALHEKGGVVNLYLPASGIDVMRSFVNYFCREMPYEIVFHEIPSGGGLLYDDHSLTVEAFPLYHRLPCFGFIFREKPKLRHLRSDAVRYFGVPVSELPSIRAGADFVSDDGTVIENSRLTSDADPAVSYAYCSDTMFDLRVASAVAGVDTVYHEATYHSDMAAVARSRGHSTAAEAGRIASISGARRLIIGHYSKRYDDLSVLVDDAKREFHNVIAAEEGLKIDLL